MTDDLTFTVQRAEGLLALVGVAGEIDVETAPALRAGALDLIAQGHSRLILDLAQVTFCDSTGFNALIGILRCTKAAHGSLTLAAVPARLTRMLDLTGLNTLVPWYPSTEAALDAHATAGEPTVR